ncbi:MAG: hypothetical protein ABIF82_14970 [Planctomycetota bacterium]
MEREEKSALFLVLLAALVAAGAGCRGGQVPAAASDKALAGAQITMLDDFDGAFSWTLEKDWGDPAAVEAAAGAMVVRLEPGSNTKSTVSRALAPPRDLSKHNAVVVDITSELNTDCLVGLALITTAEGTFIETPSAVVHPGANRNIVFRLDGRAFKSAVSNWEHNQPAGDLSAVHKVILLVSPKSSGVVRIDNVRLAILPKR